MNTYSDSLNNPDNRDNDALASKADRYEIRWKSYLRHTHEYFLERVQTEPDDIILDLSSGSGLLAHYMIEQHRPFREMILNDIDESIQQKRKDRLGDFPNITYTCATAHELPFDGHAFTKVFCLSAFHEYTSQPKVLEEVARILKPGGEFYILDWNRSGFFRLVNTMIKWYVPYEIKTRSHREMTRMLEKSGFRTDDLEIWNYQYWHFYFIKASYPK